MTIPKEIRERLGIAPGSEVDFVPTENSVRLITFRENPPREESTRGFREAVDRMAGTLDLGGMTADDYFERIRGPREDLNPR